MKTRMTLIIVMSLVLAVPALAKWTRAAQAANTTISIATTDANVVISKPDQMVKTLWEAPLVKFPGAERMGVEVTVIQSGGYGQMLNQISDNLSGMSRTCWTEHQQAKNLQVFTGKPKAGNLVLRQTLSYVTGQNSNQSGGGSSNSYNSRNGHYSDSRSDSQSTTTQESYVSLHTELVRIGDGQEDVLYATPDIQAYENGTIAASGSTSGSNSSGNNGYGRNFFGYRTYPSYASDQHYEYWSWQNSSQLLEAKSARSLAQYLASGSYALLCQQIKAEQGLSAEAPKSKPPTEEEAKRTTAP